MKQTLFLLVCAAAVLSSCSKDETLNSGNDRGIDFRAAMATRATETTTASLSSFITTAIDNSGANYFTDVEFTKSGSFFTSSPAYYWPSDGSSLTFYAYAPAAADLGATVTINNSTKQLANYAPAADITDQLDFITATATGSKTNETTGVALTFQHRLTQIEVKAKNSNDAYVFKVQGVKIGQPVSKASFDFGTSTWALGADKADYTVEYSDTRTLNATAASIMATTDNNAMLIPQQLVAWEPDTDGENTAKGAYLAVKVNITTKDGARVYPEVAKGEYGWAAVAIDTNWEPGKKYVYTLDFSNGAGRVDPEDPDNPGETIMGSPIKFTVTVDPWQEFSPAPDIEM